MGFTRKQNGKGRQEISENNCPSGDQAQRFHDGDGQAVEQRRPDGNKRLHVAQVRKGSSWARNMVTCR